MSAILTLIDFIMEERPFINMLLTVKAIIKKALLSLPECVNLRMKKLILND